MQFKEKTLKMFGFIAFAMITMLLVIPCIPITSFMIQEIKTIISSKGGIHNIVQVISSIADMVICAGMVYVMKMILIEK